MTRENVVYPYIRTLFNNKRKDTSDIYYNMDDKQRKRDPRDCISYDSIYLPEKANLGRE